MSTTSHLNEITNSDLTKESVDHPVPPIPEANVINPFHTLFSYQSDQPTTKIFIGDVIVQNSKKLVTGVVGDNMLGTYNLETGVYGIMDIGLYAERPVEDINLTIHRNPFDLRPHTN